MNDRNMESTRLVNEGWGRGIQKCVLYNNGYGTIYKMYNNEQWLLFIMRLNNKTYWKWINLSENLMQQ